MSVCPDDFIKERKYLHNVSPATITWYEQSFKRFEGALDSKTTIINRVAELRERGLSPVSINVHLRCINAYFSWLHKEHGKELIKIQRLKEEQTIIQTLPNKDIAVLLNFRPTGTNLKRAHLLALAILDTGMRASEVLGLTLTDCDLDNLVMKVKGKGNKHRLVPFSSELRKVLWRRISSRSVNDKSGWYIFGTKNNTKVSVRNFERDLNILGEKTGLNHLHPHKLRHTFACQYLKNGGNLEYLRRILGHSNLATTQKYLRSLGVEDLNAVHNSLSPLAVR